MRISSTENQLLTRPAQGAANNTVEPRACHRDVGLSTHRAVPPATFLQAQWDALHNSVTWFSWARSADDGQRKCVHADSARDARTHEALPGEYAPQSTQETGQVFRAHPPAWMPPRERAVGEMFPSSAPRSRQTRTSSIVSRAAAVAASSPGSMPPAGRIHRCALVLKL